MELSADSYNQYNKQLSCKLNMPKYSRSKSKSPRGHRSGGSGYDRQKESRDYRRRSPSSDSMSRSSGGRARQHHKSKRHESSRHKSSTQKREREYRGGADRGRDGHKSRKRRSYSSGSSSDGSSYDRNRRHHRDRKPDPLKKSSSYGDGGVGGSHSRTHKSDLPSPIRPEMKRVSSTVVPPPTVSPTDPVQNNNYAKPPAPKDQQILPPPKPLTQHEYAKPASDYNENIKDHPTSSSNQKGNFVPEVDWDKATSDRDYIYIPGQAPYRRKHKNKWSDADESEIAKQIVKEKNAQLGIQLPVINDNPDVAGEEGDDNKIRKKIYIPVNTGVNYIGLLIGPRGLYQKRLEEESGCKILIRGKGSQKQGPSSSGTAPLPGEEEDEQHVLIIGDDVDSVRKAETTVERVIAADDNTRDKIRHEQLIVAQQLNHTTQNTQVQNAFADQPLDESMMTPYGAPSPYAYIIPVPNDTVGLIIGKSGETIRRLQNESGAKIQVAKVPIKDKNIRNVFVEAEHEKYVAAKEAIDKIINDHKRANDPQIYIGEANPFGEPVLSVRISDKYVGLVIGKQGETLKGIAMASDTKIYMPQKNPGEATIQEVANSKPSDLLIRVVQIHGDPGRCHDAENRINDLIREHQERNEGKARSSMTLAQRGPRGMDDRQYSSTSHKQGSQSANQNSQYGASNSYGSQGAGQNNYYNQGRGGQSNGGSNAYSHQYGNNQQPSYGANSGQREASSYASNRNYASGNQSKKNEGHQNSGAQRSGSNYQYGNQDQQYQQSAAQQAQQYYGTSAAQVESVQPTDPSAAAAYYQQYSQAGAYDEYYAQQQQYYGGAGQAASQQPAGAGEEQHAPEGQLTAEQQQQWTDYYAQQAAYQQYYYGQQAPGAAPDGQPDQGAYQGEHKPQQK